MTNWNGLLDTMTATVRDMFGEAVSYRRAETGEVFEIRGVFDIDHEPLDAGGGVTVTSRIPVLDIRDDDLGFEPLPEDEVTVAGKSYRVIDTYPSSAKTHKLHLRKK